METGEDTELAFAARMVEEVQRREWRLEDLAARVAEQGVPLNKSAFSKMASGTRMVRLGEARAISAALGVPLGAMLITGDAAEIARELKEVQEQMATAAAESDDALARSAALWNRAQELIFALNARQAPPEDGGHGPR